MYIVGESRQLVHLFDTLPREEYGNRPISRALSYANNGVSCCDISPEFHGITLFEWLLTIARLTGDRWSLLNRNNILDGGRYTRMLRRAGLS